MTKQNQNEKMFVAAISHLAKSVHQNNGRQNSGKDAFSWAHVKPFLKTLIGHSRQQKVMALAWKLYKASPMKGDRFDRKRFALYVSCAHAEVAHENAAPKTLSLQEIRFIGSDCASKPER